jgi:hypothetical protein
MIGELHTLNTLLLCKEIGKADNSQDGDARRDYVLLLGMTGTMAVRCTQTDKTFVVGWKDILSLAVEAGINEVHSKPGVKHCIECGELQHESPSGPVCKNGHGGAAALEDEPK